MQRRRLLLCFVAPCAACSLDAERVEVGVYRAPAPAPSKASYFLTLILRDFKRYDARDASTNPAFENLPSEKSVVASSLGADHLPVYRAPDNAVPSYGAAFFDQWYRDVPGTNLRAPYPLPLTLLEDGSFEFDSQKTGRPDVYQGVARRVFFPLDDGDSYATAFGNQGAPHNQAFTGELHARFVASAGSTLSVRGDDDVYLFINGQLVVDLGGTHAALARSVALDELGLESGASYPLDLFYAERQGATGDFMLKTTLQLGPVVY